MLTGAASKRTLEEQNANEIQSLETCVGVAIDRPTLIHSIDLLNNTFNRPTLTIPPIDLLFCHTFDRPTSSYIH